MSKAELFEFLDYWSQQDQSDGDSKPINPYQLGGYMLSPGFHLKWYLGEKEFLALATELNFETEAKESGKFLFEYSDQHVEIEMSRK
jgi:hypothetical protein